MNNKYVVVVTGGGTGVFGKLLDYGGGSEYFLEGIIPYSERSLENFLAFKPEKCCSALTARQIASAALQRARRQVSDSEAVGIGCTATLARNGPEREGRQHKFYVAQQTVNETICSSFLLNTKLTRNQQERIVSSILWSTCRPDFTSHFDDDIEAQPYIWNAVTIESSSDKYKLEGVLFGVDGFRVIGNKNGTEKNSIIYCGSFNPIHSAHLKTIEWINKKFGKMPYLELSVTNADKAKIDYIDITERVGWINASNPAISGIIISNAPLFSHKIWMHKSPTFVVGTDTFNRIFDSKYHSDINKFNEFIEFCRIMDVKFFVLDRKNYTANLAVVDKYELYKFCTFVDKSEYEDFDGVSSSKIRAVAQNTKEF